MGFDYQHRRKRLLERLPDRSLVVLESAPKCIRNRDVEYPFRQCSHFLYLTGWDHPCGAMALYKDGAHISQLWGCDPVTDDERMWLGHYPDPKSAAVTMGFDEALNEQAFSAWVADTAHKAECIYVMDPSMLPDWADVDKTHSAAVPLAQLRLYKDHDEIVLMDQAAAISLQAHQVVQSACQAGVSERALYGCFLASIYEQGAQAEAYSAIVASGHHACVLHYHRLDGICQNGDLLLVDAGAELNGYASDITRTYPVGCATYEQRAILAAVHDTQQRIIERIAVGVRWSELNDWTRVLLCEHLVDLGLLNGSVDALVEQGAYKAYFPHGVGHWLGLDVHDVGLYKDQDGQSTVLEAGMVFTIEPGLYINPDDTSVPKAYRGVGVRIEDDIVLTEHGPRILGVKHA